ncbi:hypothetical protein ATANTOWER_027735 [Ataeniobius toweri]|uniref:Uncharacterized protein n=1 Tax=Ataeniobius toweri TaxID=208326 RepID=A0ABU7C1F3_9TELE|nr:hypothetical protein [Ataeniobius toweri]
MACICIKLYQVPRDPKALYTTNKSFNHCQSTIHPHIHTLTLVGYTVATAALGHTDRIEAAIQSVPQGPLTTVSRQGGCFVSCPRTQRLRRGFKPATHRTNPYHCCPTVLINVLNNSFPILKLKKNQNKTHLYRRGSIIFYGFLQPA